MTTVIPGLRNKSTWLSEASNQLEKKSGVPDKMAEVIGGFEAAELQVPLAFRGLHFKEKYCCWPSGAGSGASYYRY